MKDVVLFLDINGVLNGDELVNDINSNDISVNHGCIKLINGLISISDPSHIIITSDLRKYTYPVQLLQDLRSCGLEFGEAKVDILTNALNEGIPKIVSAQHHINYVLKLEDIFKYTFLIIDDCLYELDDSLINLNIKTLHTCSNTGFDENSLLEASEHFYLGRQLAISFLFNYYISLLNEQGKLDLGFSDDHCDGVACYDQNSKKWRVLFYDSVHRYSDISEFVDSFNLC